MRGYCLQAKKDELHHRLPCCETQFLITKVHLKAYRGKVQCGHCNHVFNAKNRLTEVSEDIQNIEEYAADQENTLASEASYTESFTEPEFTSTSAITETSEDDFDDHESIVPSIAHTYVEPVSNSDGKPLNEKLNVVLEGVPDLSDLNSIENTPEFTSPESVTDQNSRSPYISNQTPIIIPENDIDIDAVRAPILIEDLTTDPKFQLSKPKRSLWLLSINLLLLILAIAQGTYFLRSKIAAEYPQFKPYLVQACTYLGCSIQLPEQLDLITIDDSDMQESDDYKDVINFSSLLINHANHVLAYPNIELTLTDSEDKPVLRRLVKPQEYLPDSNNPDTGLAPHQEERIKLAINVHDLSVAGYRVQLTY